jgi:hypothetical protein
VAAAIGRMERLVVVADRRGASGPVIACVACVVDGRGERIWT